MRLDGSEAAWWRSFPLLGQAGGRPSKDLRAAARDLELCREGFEVGDDDGSAVEVGEFLEVADRLDFLTQALWDSLEPDFQRFEDGLLLGEDQTFLATFLTAFLAKLFGE